MAKTKSAVGTRVEYQLSGDDARRLNQVRTPKQQQVQAGQRALLTIAFEHGGDCVDGTIKYEGDELFVERRNRGFGEGQWDWRVKDTAECEAP